MGIYEGWTKSEVDKVSPGGDQMKRIRNMAEELKRRSPEKYTDCRLYAIQDVLNWDGIETYLTQELTGLDAAEDANQNTTLRNGA